MPGFPELESESDRETFVLKHLKIDRNMTIFIYYSEHHMNYERCYPLLVRI
jgi:hypothetical protein